MLIDGVNVTASKLWHKRIEGTLSQEGTSASIHLDYTNGGTLPVKGSSFDLTLDSGHVLALRSKTVTKATERYDLDGATKWTHEAFLVDRLTYLLQHKLPDLPPFVTSTTGAILQAVLASADAALTFQEADGTGSSLAAGNVVASLNLRDFSSIGDLLNSEIMSAGYKLRMGSGRVVQGGYEDDFTAFSDMGIDQDSDIYSPHRFEIDPPQDVFDSVTVSPTLEVPTHRVAHYIEEDGRVQSTVKLNGAPFGLEQTDVFRLSAGTDISDPKQWTNTGVDTDAGNFILLAGKLYALEARPYIAPFVSHWKNVTPRGGSFKFGFVNGQGTYIWSVTSAEIASALCGGSLPVDSTLDQNTFDIYTLPSASSSADHSIEVWASHLHQDFDVDETEVLATVLSASYAAPQTVTLSAPWTIDNGYIKFQDPDSGLEIGRSRIISRSGATLEVDALPVGVVAGVEVLRGVNADSLVTTAHIKTVSADMASGIGYGLPCIEGNDTYVESMSVQRMPQIEGYLLSVSGDSHEMDTVYPRALLLDAEVSEHSDGVVTGSGTGADITWHTKFTHAPRMQVLLNYVIGGKHDFDHSCGSDGSHVTVPIDKEQDPVVLAALAARICALGSRAKPRATGNMHSKLVDGTPLPFDPFPVNVAANYQVPGGAVVLPIQTVNIKFVGCDDDDDMILYSIEAGDKTAAERIQQEILRGKILTKYPLRVATIGGVRITNATWDDETFSASISGASGVFDSRGNSVDLGGGIDPAALAGVPNKHAAPVILRLTADGGNIERDHIVIQVVYPPEAVNADAATSRLFAKEKLVEYNWPTPAGASETNIYRKKAGATGETDADLELVDTIIAPASSWRGPIDKTSKDIWVETVGLCDKKSAKVKLTLTVPHLDAPTPVSVRKAMKPNGACVILVGPPPAGGIATNLRLLVRRASTSTTYTVRSDFPIDNDDVMRVDFPVTYDTTAARYKFVYDLHAPGEKAYFTVMWVDMFDDEGDISTPEDAANPPLEVGSISTSTFFRSPDPLSPLTNQADGGTYLDDDDTTTKIDETGLFRINIGQNTNALNLWFERSTKTADDTVGTWPTDEDGIFSHERYEVTDQDILNGYVDIPLYRKFLWAKRKHFTYRPYIVTFIGVRERGVDDGSGNVTYVKEKKFLVGYPGDPTGQPIVAHVTDAYFNKESFQFKPWHSGLDHNYYKVQNVTARQKPSRIKLRFEAIDDSNLRRYIAIISETNFGTKGPSTDSAMVTDLDQIMAPDSEGGGGGHGDITIWNQTNTTKNVSAVVLDIGTVPAFDFETGETYGSITISADTTYYCGVLAQNKAGRYSDELSDTDSDVTGDPGTGAAEPGALAFPSAPTGTDNSVDGESETFIGHIRQTIATASGTFAANNITQVSLVLVRRNAANSADVGTNFSEDHVLTAAELTTSSLVHEYYLKAGTRFRIVSVIAVNGDKVNETVDPAGPTTFISGGLAIAASGITELTSVSLSLNSSLPYDGQNPLLTLNFTQPGTPVALRNCFIEVSTDGGSTFAQQEDLIGLRDNIFHTTGAKVVPLRTLRTKKLLSHIFRVTIQAQGGATRQVTLTATTPDSSSVGANTDVPSGLTAPVIKKVKPAALKIDLALPTANNVNLTCKVYVANGDHATATRWMSADDLKSVVLIESQGAIEAPPSGGYPVPVTKDDMLGGNLLTSGVLTVYAKWTNNFGDSAYSAGTPYTAGSDSSYLKEDDGPVTGLLAPVVNVLNKGTHIKFPEPTPFTATWQKTRLVVADRATKDSSTRYLNPVDLNSLITPGVAKDTTAWIDSPRSKTLLGITKSTWERLFGVGATVYFWYYAVNVIDGGHATESVSVRSPVLAYSLTTGALSDASNNAVPGALAIPTQLNSTTNTIKGDPSRGVATVTLHFATVNAQSFDANNIKGVAINYTKRDGSPGGNIVGQWQTQQFVFGTGAFSAIDVDFEFPIGQRFNISQIVALNGDQKFYTDCSLDFYAGGIRKIDTGDAGSVPVPTIPSVTQEPNNNKVDNVVVSIAQAGGIVIYLKRLELEISLDGGTTWTFERSLPLREEVELYTGTLTKSWTMRVKRPAGGTVPPKYRARAFAVGNGVAGTYSTIATSGVTTGDVTADAAAPSPAPVITKAKLKAAGLVLEVTLPTTNMLSFDHIGIIIDDGAGSYYDPFLASWGGFLETNVQQSVPTLLISPDQIFTTTPARTSFNVTVKVYNRYNNGSSVLSNVKNVAKSNADPDVLGKDGGNPVITQAPKLNWFDKDGLVVSNMIVDANFNTLRTKKVYLKSSGGTIFDLKTYVETGVAQAATFPNGGLDIGPYHKHVSIGGKLKHFRNVLGSTAILQSFFVVTNDFSATGTQSGVSNNVDLGTSQDISGSRAAITVVDAGIGMDTATNILSNSDYQGFKLPDFFGRLDAWGWVNSLSSLSDTNTIQPINTGGTTVAWNDVAHKISVASPVFVVSIGKNEPATGSYIPDVYCTPGEIYTISAMLNSPSGVALSGEIWAYLVASNGSVIYNNPAKIPVDTLSTSWIMGAGQLDVSALHFTGDKVFVLDFTHVVGLNSSHPIEVDRVSANRGKTIKAHSPRVKLEGVNLPGSLSSGPPGGIGNPTGGTQGGGVSGVGHGVLVQLEAL